MKKNEHSLRDTWDTTKLTNNMCNGSTRRGRDREKSRKKFKEIMAENSPDILKTYTSGSSRNSK